MLATLVLACLTYLFVGPYLLPMYFHFDIPLLIGIEGGALLFALFLSYPMSAYFLELSIYRVSERGAV